MLRMLSANDASFISAGMGEPPHKQELQKLLDLIESEVRYAASAGRNKAPLLGEEFKGWDSANISDPHDVMSLVFQILREEGYSFQTEQMLQIGNNESTCTQVPYPHTVVTWPKGQKPEAQTELTLEERTEIAESLGKDLEYVDPVFAQPTMPPKGVFPPTTLPVPFSRIGKFVVALRQAGFDVASSKDMLPQDLLDLEKFEDDPETRKAYEKVLECLLEAVKRGDSELRMCLSIDCKIGRIAQYLRPLGFSGDCTVHAHPRGSIGPHALLILKWSAIKC